MSLSAEMMSCYLIAQSSTMNADVALIFSNIILIQYDIRIPSASVGQVDKA